MKKDDMRGAVIFRRPSDGWGFSMICHCITEDPAVTDGAFRLYASLLKFAQQKDRCWPGIKRLAEKRGISERTVKREMACLIARRLITRERKLGTSWTTILEPVDTVYTEWPLNEDRNGPLMRTEMAYKEEEGKNKKLNKSERKISNRDDGSQPPPPFGSEAASPPVVVQASPSEKEGTTAADELSFTSEATGETALDQALGPRTPHPPIERKGTASGNWATPAQAGGADAPAQAFVDKLTAHYGMGGWDALPPRKAQQWASKVAEAFKAWGGCDIGQAHLAADAYVDQFGWRDSFNPYEKTFPDNAGGLLAKIREGTITREGLRAKAAATEPARESALEQRRRLEAEAEFARDAALTPEELTARELEGKRVSDAYYAKRAIQDAAIAQEKADEKARAVAERAEAEAVFQERKRFLCEQAEALGVEV